MNVSPINNNNQSFKGTLGCRSIDGTPRWLRTDLIKAISKDGKNTKVRYFNDEQHKNIGLSKISPYYKKVPDLEYTFPVNFDKFINYYNTVKDSELELFF